MAEQKKQLLIVTGMSGAGKTVANKALEDMGLVVNIGYSEDASKDNGIVLKQTVEVGKVIDEGTTVTITVNKLAEVKTVPIKVNVKSLLDGNITETVKDENGDEIQQVKDVQLKVTVGNDTIYSQTVKASETAVSVGNAKGTGTTTVKVYIDGVLKNDGGYTLVYSNVNSYTAE